MEKIIKWGSVPICQSIHFWQTEGFHQNQSKDFFEAMIGFMETFEINEKFVRISLFNLFVETKLCTSKAEVKRLLPNNCLTANNIKLSNGLFLLDKTNLAHEKFMMLGRGKSERVLIVWTFS